MATETDNTFGELYPLFQNIGEPVFYPKGNPDDAQFYSVPNDHVISYFNDEYMNQVNVKLDQGTSIQVREMNEKLRNSVKNVIIKIQSVVSRKSMISLYITKHQEITGYLIDFLLNLSVDDFLSAATFMRDRINRELFYYACSVVLFSRDIQVHGLLKHAEVFPHKYFDRNVIGLARIEATLFQTVSDRLPVEMSFDLIGNDGNSEAALSYFREDLGINLHHFHWYQIYPIKGPARVVNKDRRGELFSYMYRQILIRYNIERLCNDMGLTQRLLDWELPIPEAHFPKLSDRTTGTHCSPRPPDAILSDVNRPEVQVDLEDLIRYKERIIDSIHRGRVRKSDGRLIDIRNDQGIDVLGNMIQANDLSPDLTYYGDLNNLGHVAISFVHDPQFQYRQTPGVMAQVSTSMRDPVFYRWQAYIDDIFAEHRNVLPAYNRTSLDFPNQLIEINSLEVQSLNELGTDYRNDKNNLYTFMTRSNFDLSFGLSFVSPGPTYVSVQQLNHDEFEYRIKVTNKSKEIIMGTVRIFMAPTRGPRDANLTFNQQKDLMIEMDKFVTRLKPGANMIKRMSDSSSVIIPFNQIFANLNSDGPEKSSYCQCGWPQNMLLPIGTVTGYPMMLFVMITDYSNDAVHQENNDPSELCKTAMSFCGLKNKKYPDRRPMGYPFDRRLSSDTLRINEFLTPNMAVQNIRIYHLSEERQNQSEFIGTTPSDFSRNNGAINP